MIKLKRVYDAPSGGAGFRVLIERLWPLEADPYYHQIHLWAKDVAPSYDLLEWFREHPREWSRFKEKYLKELEDSAKKNILDEFKKKAEEGHLTLLFGESSAERSAAGVVYELLEKK